MLILWELVNANLKFMKAELCECGFYKYLELRLWNLWELSIEKVNFMWAKLYICEFRESWVLQIWIYESLELQIWILRELSFTNVHVMRAKHCELRIESVKLWKLGDENMNSMSAEFWKCEYMSADHCECEFIESWGMQLEI